MPEGHMNDIKNKTYMKLWKTQETQGLPALLFSGRHSPTVQKISSSYASPEFDYIQ
jgi:hypothetical protein